MKRALQNFSLSLLGLAMMFLVLEISFRAAGFHPVDLTFQPVAYSRELGWQLKASYDHVWQELEWRVPYRTNRMGFRDEDHALAKPAGVFRILILGGSLGEGNGVREEDRWSFLLRQGLPEKVEVINLGVRGYDILQQYRQFILLGQAFQPDCVIQILGASNFNAAADAIVDQTNRFRPDFEIKDGHIRFAAAPDGRPVPLQRWSIIKQLKGFFYRSAFCVWLRHKWEQTSRGWIWGRLIWNHAVMGTTNSRPQAAYGKKYTQAMAAVYQDFSSMAKQQGFKMLVVGVSPPKIPADFAQQLKDAGISWINVNLPPSLRFGFDPHPNPLGQRAIAAAVLRSLNEEALVHAPAHPV